MKRVSLRVVLSICLVGAMTALFITACGSPQYDAASQAPGARHSGESGSPLAAMAPTHRMKSDSKVPSDGPAETIAGAQPTDEVWVISRGTSDQPAPPKAAHTDES